MIQRIQTLLLLIASGISGGLIFIFSLWKNLKSNEIFALDTFDNESMLTKSIGAIFIISAILSLITIFLFKNRKLQFVMNRLNILLNFLLVGFIVYHLLTLSGETKVSEKGIGSFLPLLSVLFLVFANRYIKKDEDLVKSVDRLR